MLMGDIYTNVTSRNRASKTPLYLPSNKTTDNGIHWFL